MLEKFPVLPPREAKTPRESNLRRTPSRPSVSFCSSVGFSEGGGTFDLENCACTKCNAASVYDPPPPTLVSEAEVTPPVIQTPLTPTQDVLRTVSTKIADNIDVIDDDDDGMFACECRQCTALDPPAVPDTPGPPDEAINGMSDEDVSSSEGEGKPSLFPDKFLDNWKSM